MAHWLRANAACDEKTSAARPAAAKAARLRHGLPGDRAGCARMGSTAEVPPPPQGGRVGVGGRAPPPPPRGGGGGGGGGGSRAGIVGSPISSAWRDPSPWPSPTRGEGTDLP